MLPGAPPSVQTEIRLTSASAHCDPLATNPAGVLFYYPPRPRTPLLGARQCFFVNSASHCTPTPRVIANASRPHLSSSRLQYEIPFSWDRVDATQGRCGEFKCFYASSHSAAVGYIVAREHNDRYERWHASWQLADALHATHAIQHTFLEPPRQLTISREVAVRLDGNNTWAGGGWGSAGSRFANASSVLVQRVRRCEMPYCILVGCIPKKINFFRAHLDEFLTGVAASGRQGFTAALDDLLCALARSLNATLPLLASQPCLRIDFQAFIKSDGSLLHMDLDRCYSNTNTTPSSWWDATSVAHCFGRVLSLVQAAIDRVITSQQRVIE